MTEITKVAVLGSNSFAGAQFVDMLLKKGHEVIGLSRSQEPNPIFLPYKQNSKIANFRFHQKDLNNNFEDVISILNDIKPEYIVDFAAQSMVAESWQHPEHWYQTNFVAKVKLHNHIKNYSFLKKYVRISTPEVYGSCETEVLPDHPFNPSTPYAVSQAAIDMSLNAFYKQYDFPVTFTRIANYYGQGQQLYRIIPRAMVYSVLGKKLQLHGGGKSIRSFIHCDDFCEGIYLSMIKGKSGHVYHFGTPEYISIKELVEKICNHMQIDFEELVDMAPDRPGKDQGYYLNCRSSMEELEWQPKVSIDEGIRLTAEWVKKNSDIIRNESLNYNHKP